MGYIPPATTYNSMQVVPSQDLPLAAPLGLLILASDTKQLYMGTGVGIAPLGAMPTNGAPTGNCSFGQLATDTTTGNLYACNGVSNTWAIVSGGASILGTNNIFTGTNQFNNISFKGPNPWIDVTAYGARSLASNFIPAAVGITGSITNGTASLSVSTSSCPSQTGSICFVNGDGIVIYGAGAPHSMITPAAPTVVSSLASSATGVGGLGFTVAGPTGATTYNYQIVARDKNGGLTAAGTVGSTTTGATSLGTQSVNITSISNAPNANAIGGIATVTTSSAHGLVVGAMVRIQGVSAPSQDFTGWFNVATVPDNTHFTYAHGVTTTESVTGGTVEWWNCNHLSWTAVTGAWEYYIYGRTGGSLTLLGVSKPNQGSYVDTTWDDYGSPMMDGIALPPYVPATPPGSATSDNLTTTITSGAGTTSLVLAASAGTTVSGATVRYDTAPNIATAAAAANFATSLYFPAGGTYVINSFLDLSALTLSVMQVGTIQLNETMKLGTGTKWYGDRVPLSASPPQFAFQGNAIISVNTANPGIHALMQQGLMQGVQISGTGNASQLMVVDGGFQITLNDTTFVTGGGASDYMGIGLNIRSAGVGVNAFELHFNRVTLFSAQGITTATPLMVCDRCGSTVIDSIQLSGRGTFWVVQETGGQNVNVNWAYTQAGNTPLFMVSERGTLGGAFTIKNTTLDTTTASLFSSIVNGGQGHVVNCQGCGTTIGSGDGAFSGISLASLVTDGGATGQNTNVTNISGGLLSTTSNQNLLRTSRDLGVKVGGTLGVGYGLSAPAAPTVVVGGHGSCVSTCVAAGTYFYYVIALDANSGTSPPSLASASATTDGTQTITISWVLQNGQTGTYVGRNTVSSSGVYTGVNVPGNSTTDTSTTFYSVSTPSVTGYAEGITVQGFAGHQVITVDPNTSNTSTITGPRNFANLSTPVNGTFCYCPDCTIANPCAGSGTGALAKRLNGVWVCN